MDQSVLDGLQHLRLTKEEEEDIFITAVCRSDLLEERSLSLFGRLLLDRHQNHRALKSTLRSAWRMGSDLKIVNVDKGIFQFKFSSDYQREWVERNGILKTTCCFSVGRKRVFQFQIFPSHTLHFGSKFGVYHLKISQKRWVKMWETVWGTILK